MKRKKSPSPTKHISTSVKISKTGMGIGDLNEDSHKEEKYDRQLRLWGINGQRALETAHVCLLNVTTAGTEAMKCLVLPGIGKFSIVDDTDITEEDIGNNFFFDSTSVGKSKAKTASQLLQELNPDTVGSYVLQNPINLLDNDPEFFKSVHFVICSRLNEHNLVKLGNFLWLHSIPLIVCDNFGLFGILRLVIKEHVVIEAHPDNTLEDLRLDKPFPELVEYMNNIQLDTLERGKHSHTPYLVILYKYLQKWCHENGKTFPKDYQEKRQIKDMIRNGMFKNEHGVEIMEENFEEAMQNVNNALNETKLTSNVQVILDEEMTNHPLQSEMNSQFWILVCALKEFVNLYGVVPLRGSLPDMFADSKRYIELQNIFRNKATEDCQKVEQIVQELLQDLQLPSTFVSQEYVKMFCKNASFIQFQRGLSLHDEFKQDLASHKIKDGILATNDTCYNIYLVYRALLRFAEYENFPMAAHSDQVMLTLKKHLSDVITSLSLEHREISEDYLTEVLRCKVNEVHTTAAIMGGLCSQEVIKILTKQFIPVDNTYIYDGISHESTMVKL